MADTSRTDTDRDNFPEPPNNLMNLLLGHMGNPLEAVELTKIVLDSDWLAAHDAEVRRQALVDVLALADEWDREADNQAQWRGRGYAERLRAAVDAADPTAHDGCDCPPCPGRGNDGHGMTHCAECCFGTGVEADPDCPNHGERAADPTEGTRHD